MREKYFFPLFLFRVSCYTIVVLLRTFPRAVQIPKVAYPGQGARKRLSFEKMIKRSFIMLTAITGINWGDEGKVHGKGCLLKKDKEVIYYAYCNYEIGRAHV